MSSSLSLSLSVVSSVELNEMCSKMLYDICSRNDISYEAECNRFGVVPCVGVGPIAALSVAKSVGVGPIAALSCLGAITVAGVSKSVGLGPNAALPIEKKAAGGRSYKGAFPLPFCGKKVVGCCLGLKENEGLMTQCRVSVKSGDFCKTCENQGIKNGTSMPKYGTIDDRMKCDTLDYVAPNGDRPTKYAAVMAKYNLTKEAVLAECEKAGVEMDVRHFEVVAVEGGAVKGKGRPRKADKVVDGATGVTAAAAPSPASAGRRGRPKKDSKVIELDGDDLFAALVAEGAKPVEEVKAVIEKPVVEKKKADEEVKAVEKAVEEVKAVVEKPIEEVKAVVEKPIEEEEEEEEETDVVTKVEINGKKYLKSKNSGVIYDIDTQDEIGEWNAKENKIDFYEEEEEEYEEE